MSSRERLPRGGIDMQKLTTRRAPRPFPGYTQAAVRARSVAIRSTLLSVVVPVAIVAACCPATHEGRATVPPSAALADAAPHPARAEFPPDWPYRAGAP